MNRALLFLLLVGCVEEKGQIKGTQSIYVELVSPGPATPNDVNNRLPPTTLSVTVNIAARNAEGELDTTFNDMVRVYAQFLGTLTPELNELPIKTITVANGVASN